MKWISVLLFSIVAVLASTRPVLANNGFTTSDVEHSQVRVRNDNGVIYLTTETLINGTGERVTVTDTDGDGDIDDIDREVITETPVSTEAPLEDVEVDIPQGFAVSFGGLLNGVLSFVLVVAALLVFAFLILGAFQWITSGGDKGKTDQARQKIMAAIVGLIIIASSYAILSLALRFLGFASLNDLFDSAGTIRGGAATVTTPASPSADTNLETLLQTTPSPTPNL